jgi:GDP-L-fucose synthase
VRAVQRQNPFVVWGTGESIRDFIYVTDLAQGMVLALEKYATCDPINIGGGKPVKIKELVHLILKLTGHEQAAIKFSADKPLGPVVKISDLSKSREELGFSAQVSLEEGLKRTIDWYLNNKDYMKGYRPS